jgi:1,4-alpha-glucan branching enzyme
MLLMFFTTFLFIIIACHVRCKNRVGYKMAGSDPKNRMNQGKRGGEGRLAEMLIKQGPLASKRKKSPTIGTASRQEVRAILSAEHGDPFRILGIHRVTFRGKPAVAVRAFLPEARQAWVMPAEADEPFPMRRLHPRGFFETVFPGRNKVFPYRLRIQDDQGRNLESEDPYAFPPVLTDFDLHLIAEGTHYRNYEKLGAHPMVLRGVRGVHFAVWAPNAKRVSVIGDFNRWDGRRHPMRIRSGSGVWELFVPGLDEGEIYKFEIKSGPYLLTKADPYAFFFEVRPKSASIVRRIDEYGWNDGEWMAGRVKRNGLDAPLSIYEVHLGSWRRVPEEGQRMLSYRESAGQLVEHMKEMGFTHVELLPIMEHPFDGSWGYQALGYFAPTSRFGRPEDFKFFVDLCHRQGIGVILDWVPAHFPKDGHGLASFDGTFLYEHADSRQREHPDWGTLIFNYGRHEVRNFLIGNALFWLREYHVDGLRVDGVASMLYLDYSRRSGEWVSNIFGGNENLEAIDFLKKFNERVHGEFPGTLTVAEESTAWPMVSRPTYLGGLGFSLKWNMGWMHDTLEYISKDPIYRKHHHNNLTFSLLYAFHENFILPLSHDEVVHGKRSLLDKMPGDLRQKFSNLRLLYGFMFGHPGKKLLFMGSEFGQWREWAHNESLDWHLLQFEPHRTLQKYLQDLNRLYLAEPAFYEIDFHWSGFEWIAFQDWERSIVAFLRRAKNPDNFLIFVCNFTPVLRSNYRIGVPEPGFYKEILNSDSSSYGGGNAGNDGGRWADPISWQGRPYSLSLTLPPLGFLVLKPGRG